MPFTAFDGVASQLVAGLGPINLRCSIEIPVQRSDGQDEDPMSIMSPENPEMACSIVYLAPSPISLVLLGNIHVALIWIVDAGSKTVDGTVTPANGSTLQGWDGAGGPAAGRLMRIPRASMTAPVEG